MKYYSKCDDKIRKIDVEFDFNKLENIKQEIIKNCSLITHFEYDATVFPESNKIRNVCNLSYELIGNRDEPNFYSPDRNVYHFSFDEYKFPYLVRLINELQSGNSDALCDIINPNYEMEEKILGNQINDFSENQVPIGYYYIKVRGLIKLTKIDEYDYDLFKENCEFFGTKNNKNIERVLKK